jgi:prepilin-type processing-associated H-X9-DG protein
MFPAANMSVRLGEVTDGQSNTLWVGERPCDEVGEWGHWFGGSGFDGHGLADHALACEDGLRRGVPGSSDDLTHYWSMHPGGAFFLFVDGSVKFLPYTINHNTFVALGSRNGGEVLGDF